MLKKLSPPTVGIIQIGLLFLYITLLAQLGMNAENWVGNLGRLGPIMGPSFIILTLVLSVLVSGLLTLAYPVTLFLSGQHKRALFIVFWDAVWIIVFLAMVLIYALFLTNR
ncbi:MAG: hypothetical protein V1856_01865 [Candidatus Liptonbacteria bacterium]